MPDPLAKRKQLQLRATSVTETQKRKHPQPHRHPIPKHGTQKLTYRRATPFVSALFFFPIRHDLAFGIRFNYETRLRAKDSDLPR